MLVNYRRETGILGMRQLPAEAADINESNLKSQQSRVYFLEKSLGLGISLGLALDKGLGHLIGYKATE